MILPWRDVEIGGRLIHTSLTSREADALARLAAGRLVLEIGSANGYSAVTMARTARHVFAVDPHRQIVGSLDRMRDNLQALGLEDRVTIMASRSDDALWPLVEMGCRFGMVFVDGDHAEQAVRTDVSVGWALLGDAGVLACHDYGEDTCPGVKVALDEAFRDANVDLEDTLWVARRAW